MCKDQHNVSVNVAHVKSEGIGAVFRGSVLVTMVDLQNQSRVGGGRSGWFRESVWWSTIIVRYSTIVFWPYLKWDWLVPFKHSSLLYLTFIHPHTTLTSHFLNANRLIINQCVIAQVIYLWSNFGKQDTTMQQPWTNVDLLAGSVRSTELRVWT